MRVKVRRINMRKSVEPRDSYAATITRRTVFKLSVGGIDELFTIREDGDRVAILFQILDGPAWLVPYCPSSFSDGSNPEGVSDFYGFEIATTNNEVDGRLFFTYGDYGPLVQGAWNIVLSGAGGSVIVFEIFDNPNTRKALSCNTVK